MLRIVFKVLFRVALVFAAVLAVAALLRRLEGQKPDYIEIYSNGGLDGENC